MRILKALPLGVLIFCLVAQDAQSADEQNAEETGSAAKSRSIFVKSVASVWVDVVEKLLSDAEALINSGKPAEAYALLEPRDFDYAGNSRYDYLLGISALDSGHADKATLAFERVLAVDPNFAGARLDMARAYFHLGDMERAKTELEAVMKQDPPEEARITIEKYLNAIAAAELAKKTHYSAYVEGTIGHDSNVNNSTSQSEIEVPALNHLVFTLSPTNLKTPDNYYSAGAGGDASKALTERWGVYGGGDVHKRGNRNMTAFDSASVDTHAGVSFSNGNDIFRLGGTFGKYTLAEVAYRDSFGLSADWRHSFSQRNQLNFFAQSGRNRFAQSTMQINDFDQTVLGTSMLHILADGKTAVFGSINLGNERAVNNRADGNKTGYGLRLGGQTAIAESIEAYASAGYQIGRYDKENVAFLANRSDKQYDVTVGGNWHCAKFWTVRPQVAYTKNNSDIPIYSFDRLDASINARRDF